MATNKLSSFHLDSTIVELATLEDIARDLIQEISKSMDAGSAQAFQNKCDTFISEGQLQALVEAFIDMLLMVGGKSKSSEMKMRFSILFSLARHLPAEVMCQVIPRIEEGVIQLKINQDGDKNEFNKMKMEVLRNLYTVVDPRHPSRYSTLETMLKFALENHVFGILDGTAASDIDEVVNTWNSDPIVAEQQKRKILMMYSDLCEEKCKVLGPTMDSTDFKQEELKHHRFLVKLIETYESNPELLAEAVNYSVRATFLSIKYPLPGDMAESNTMEEHSLDGLKRGAAAILAAESNGKSDWSGLTASASAIANYACVKYISSKPEHQSLYQLLEIFACKELKDFDAFAKSNSDFFDKVSLDENDCRKNIRFLTLASLATHAERVTYDTIAEKLQIDESEVEKWVIDGVMCKVIDAKMDQLGKSIVINRGSQRLMSDQQWVEVQSKLSDWKTSIHSLLATVKAVRQEQALLKQQGQPQ